jgi:transcriptional regulator with XRE-family HTH domain
MKRPNPEEIGRMEQALCQGLSRGEIGVREATRRMRRILGMSQKEYARRVAGISPRILSEFETGSGNPTLATLEKIASPFGMRVTFQPPDSWEGMGLKAKAASETAPAMKRKEPPPARSRPRDGRLAGRR